MIFLEKQSDSSMSSHHPPDPQSSGASPLFQLPQLTLPPFAVFPIHLELLLFPGCSTLDCTVEPELFLQDNLPQKAIFTP